MSNTMREWETPWNGLMAGCARVDITPPLSTPYLAFNPRHQCFSGIHDPLMCTAVVFQSGADRAAIVSVDGIGLHNEILGTDIHYTQFVRGLIAGRCPMLPESVMICSSHIHSTPDTLRFSTLSDFPAMGPWVRVLAEKIADAVVIAMENMFPVRVKSGTCAVPGLIQNRRGNPFLDEQMTLLLMEGQHRNVLIAHYACHPVVMQVQPLVCADYIGCMRDALESEMPDTQLMFLQGTCGDINPHCGDTRDFADAAQIGGALAKAAEAAARSILASCACEQSVSVRVKSKTLILPSKPMPKSEALHAYASDADAMARIEEGEPDYPCELQAIRVCSNLFLGIEGEPLCEMGLTLKQAHAGFTVFPIGYANGYLGYICPPSDHAKGGYEVGIGPWAKLSEDAFGAIVDGLGELVRML